MTSSHDNPPASQAVKRSKGMAALFLAGAFLVGGAVGFSADRALTHRSSQRCNTPGLRGYWETMTKEWGITPDQRRVIDSLLDVQHDKVTAMYSPVRPTIDSLRDRVDLLSDSTLAQIKLVLTPEQQKKMGDMQSDARKKAAFQRACRDEAMGKEKRDR